MQPVDLIPEAVVYWAKNLGVREDSIVALPGGVNSAVYRCDSAAHSFVVKSFSPRQTETRDRFAAEYAFLQYAGIVAPAFVPTVLEADPARRCLVLEYLAGTAYSGQCRPFPHEIDAALAFFKALNDSNDTARKHIRCTAADGFTRISEHLENVAARIYALSTDHLPINTQPLAVEMLARLHTALRATQEETANGLANGQVSDAAPTEWICVSPSDFGFHNAIRTEYGPKFFDFEFAGFDDPAKTAVDFNLQPRVAVEAAFHRFSSSLPRIDAGRFVARCTLLWQILWLKWLSIILSVCNAQRLEELRRIRHKAQVGALVQERLSAAALFFMRKDMPLGLS